MPTITDWITAAASVLLVFGLGIAVYQAHLLYVQLNDTKRWNKLTAALDHMPKSSELSELEIELNSSIVRLIDRNGPLSEAELKELWDDKNQGVRIKLKNFLNLIERYCTAINYGIVDKDFAKSIFKQKFIRHFNEMLPYIESARLRHNTPSAYIEMQKVVEEWKGGYIEPKNKY